MNKKNIFGALALATVAAFAMTSCDKSKCQVDEKKVEGKQAVPAEEGPEHPEHTCAEAACSRTGLHELPAEDTAERLHTRAG